MYKWLISKLMQMGALSRQEQQADQGLLNPLTSTMGKTMERVLKQKLLYNLVDPNEVNKSSLAMFEEPEWGHMGSQRTNHK